ncbi:MAG: hypothetical protein HC862_25765 [Scytonema sp. RU_4_4]|nr:hypothetical protein [Scytonema sp. RU_4_4]
MDNCQDVFNEFSFWRQINAVENHEFTIVLLADLVDKFDSESCESIFIAASRYGKQR